MAVKSIAQIRELTIPLKVLYVEDEESVRQSMKEILALFFDTLYIAGNGEEGVEMFRKHTPDFVISDIQMPRMNGLEMIERIRQIAPEVPVVVTTAFSEQEYFLRSIDLKVDKYLIKPIEQKQAREVLYRIAMMLDDRRKAKAYELAQIQKRVNGFAEHVIVQLMDSYQNPCIVYTDKTARYVNDAFCHLFGSAELEHFLDSGMSAVGAFEQRPGFLKTLGDFNEKDPSRNRVSISRRQGRKIYRINRQTVYLDEDKSPSLIYLFNDITLEEYQKIKILSYTEMLEELLITERYLKNAAVISAQAEQASAKTGMLASPQPKLKINEEEKALLHRSRVQKVPAREYIAELDDEVLKELQELDELDRDFGESIMLLKEDATSKGLQLMAGQLEHYAHEISLLFEFEDLAYAIRSLAKLLVSVDTSHLDAVRMEKIVQFLSGIQSDLADWRRMLFIEQSALDIHYLDSSLFSACLQIELALSDTTGEVESDEDNLILF